jgi:hypothetical protein
MSNRDSSENHPLVVLYKGVNIFLFLGVFILCGIQSFLLLNADPFPAGHTQQPGLLAALLTCAIATQALSALRMARHWQALVMLLWIFAWEVGGWGISRTFGFPFGPIEWHSGWKAGSILAGWSAWVALTAFCQWQILAQCTTASGRIVQEFVIPLLTGLLNGILLVGIIPIVRFWPGMVQPHFISSSGSVLIPGFFTVRTLWIFFVFLMALLLCPRAIPERSYKYIDPTPFSILIAVTLPLMIVALHFQLWPSLLMILLAVTASGALPFAWLRRGAQQEG